MRGREGKDKEVKLGDKGHWRKEGSNPGMEKEEREEKESVKEYQDWRR